MNAFQIYTKEIRRYISERKEVKEKLSRTSGISETGQQYLSHKIRRLYKVIDDKISDFNHQVIRGKVSEQDFWKIKEKIAPKSSELMYALTNSAGNEITEPLNIKHEYYREFRYQDKKPRDINPQTKTPLAKNPLDKNPPDKTYEHKIYFT